VLAALYDREHTGLGAVISIAMLDAVSEMMGFALNQVLHAGTEPVPVGISSPMIAPTARTRPPTARPRCWAPPVTGNGAAWHS
jgi:crotonobetainyl-CoA:carnitine CoA-transferase CaiB-like acyl-CoA transferase